MNIVIVSDAWHPQINGVVHTIRNTCAELERLGHTATVIGPDRFRSLPCPSYPEIRLALFARRRLHRMLDELDPDAVHIATEGPLGLATRRWCLKRGFPFTTAFHTQFPEYVKLRAGIPLSATYRFLRWFHGPATTVMVATRTLKQRLEQWGFHNLGMWSRGVNADLFRPGDKSFLDGPRPIFLYAGRVAVEKNIEAFLGLELPGTKYVVGGGPDLEMLRLKYPEARFAGCRTPEEMARYMTAADVFVFPSLTDTFGLVIIEALACGVPVAAYPVQGPVDIIEDGVTGCLDKDLGRAARDVLTAQIEPERCRRQAMLYTWEACTRQFLSHLATAAPGQKTRDSRDEAENGAQRAAARASRRRAIAPTDRSKRLARAPR
jgi:glycosyltransferase involved in cell wall biosynthesis